MFQVTLHVKYTLKKTFRMVNKIDHSKIKISKHTMYKYVKINILCEKILKEIMSEDNQR